MYLPVYSNPNLASPVHAPAQSFSSRIVHPSPINHKAVPSPPSSNPADQFFGYNLNLEDMIRAGVLVHGGSSSSGSSTTDGTPPTVSDSSPEMARYDPNQDLRIARLTTEQRTIYQDLLRRSHQNAGVIESLLSIAARGNIKPARKEMESFLLIEVLPETKSGKGSRRGLKKYRCKMCTDLNTDRWDTAEYHIHGHLGLKVFPCLVEPWYVPPFFGVFISDEI
jgi:hypothetical protein